MSSDRNYEQEFEKALHADREVEWLQWLEHVPKEEADELAREFFLMGAITPAWDFEWTHRKWRQYAAYFPEAQRAGIVRDLHEHQINFGGVPTWTQYAPFGLSPEDLRLLNEDDRLYLGQIIGGAYRIEHRVNHGGFGIVYRATSIADATPVAIKVPQLHCDSMGVEFAYDQVRKEAKILQCVAGQDVPAFLGMFEYDGMPVLVMEFVAGTPLSELTVGTEEEKRLFAWHLVKICETLHRLHSYGWVHGDLTPQNILIGENGIAYLIDFGLGHPPVNEAFTMPTDEPVGGSKVYIAPEKWHRRGLTVDARSDLWAIGVMLLDVFYFRGREGPWRVGLTDMHPSEGLYFRLSDIPSELASILGGCMQVHANRRFNTGEELAAALRAWLTGNEVPREGPSHYPVFFWRFGMKSYEIWSTLYKLQATTEWLQMLLRDREECPERGVEILRRHVAACHHVIRAILDVQQGAPPVPFELPKEVVDFGREKQCQGTCGEPEDLLLIADVAKKCLSSIHQVVGHFGIWAHHLGPEVENLYIFALLACGLPVFDMPLRKAAEATGLPAVLWEDSVIKLPELTPIEKMDATKTFDSEATRELRRLAMNVERYLLYRKLPSEP